MPHNIVFSKETMMPHMTLYLGFIFFFFLSFGGKEILTPCFYIVFGGEGMIPL